MDQRNCIEFCVKSAIKCARTFEMLTVAFAESAMSRTQVHLWYNRFKKDREDVNKAMLDLVARARQQAMKTLK